MRFRVAAIQDEGLPQSLTDARLWLEDWLNGALQDSDFGCPSACIMIVVFATSTLTKAPAASRLSKDVAGNPTLALHVVIDPLLVQRVRGGGHLGMLCSHVVRGLPATPLRKPKEFDYARLRQALVACIQPLSESAA